MANVKITTLTNLASADIADADVFVIDDISATETKKVTIANVKAVIGTTGLTASRALETNGSGNIVVSDITSTELNHLDGVSSAIQTQLDAKIATTTSASNDFVTFTRLNANLNTTTANVTAVETRRTQNIAGAISTVLTGDLTASRAMVTNGSGKIAISDITATELNHLDGVSSAIQTQLDAKAALAGATFSGQVNMSDDLVVTGNLTVNGDTVTANAVNLIVQDQFIALSNGGTSSMDVGIFYNRGTEGNAAVWYDASDSSFYLSETKDPFSNTTVKPTSAANLNVGAITATSFTGSGAGLTAGTTPLTTLDIDGGTDIGEAIVDADLLIIDNGAGGTNRKTAASRLKTYVADVTLTTAAQGNITSVGTLTTLTVDDIIINGTNIGHTSDTDAIAISSSGVVTMNQIPVFSAGINVSGGTIAGTLSTAAQTNITSVGTLSSLTTSGDITVGDDIFLDSDASVIHFGDDGDVTLTHVHNTGLLLNSTRAIQFNDANESVSSDGSKLILTSNGVAFNMPTADGSSGQVLQTDGSRTLSFADTASGDPDPATELASDTDCGALSGATEDTKDAFGIAIDDALEELDLRTQGANKLGTVDMGALS